MKTNNFSEKFWNDFRNAVANKNANDTSDFCYFYSKEDKKYFFDTYNSVFDEDAVETIKDSNYKELKKVTRNNLVDDINAFDMLLLPDKINEAFVFNVVYEDDSLVDDFFDDLSAADNIFRNYDADEDFDEEEDFDDFDSNSLIKIIKVFVFAQVDKDYKFMGTYNIE